MPAILFVKISTELDSDELENRMIERRPRFHDVPGLIQKIYGRDSTTGDGCGIYLFEDRAALDTFRESELARSIPAAYEGTDVRLEVFDVLFPLHPERGPL